ncbi:hypothetical protein EDB92DRAFT_1816909 [Lactarius akahatsu]|uniref:Secreted protein n=1 Tax=Lactarius akahatsu TaxID=416441 RepID=A0AAD4LGR3_9AGAM|nr:hypothetical protein EDB92DRAFT_1816909 [Lactarius akahatsu]
MPFGGRLAYFAWPLGLLCLHLARLLPDFSQSTRSSPTTFARAARAPERCAASAPHWRAPASVASPARPSETVAPSGHPSLMVARRLPPGLLTLETIERCLVPTHTPSPPPTNENNARAELWYRKYESEWVE